MITLDQLIAIFRLIPLAIAFWVAFSNRDLLPVFIAVFYTAAILGGPAILDWNYAAAVISTPLAYMVSWYMIKNVRRRL